jgi:hypothetical protein
MNLKRRGMELNTRCVWSVITLMKMEHTYISNAR